MKEGAPQPTFEELQKANLDKLYQRMDNPYADRSYRMPDQFGHGELEPETPLAKAVREFVIFQQ